MSLADEVGVTSAGQITVTVVGDEGRVTATTVVSGQSIDPDGPAVVPSFTDLNTFNYPVPEPSDDFIDEQAYLVARGVRPLALVALYGSGP